MKVTPVELKKQYAELLYGRPITTAISMSNRFSEMTALAERAIKQVAEMSSSRRLLRRIEKDRHGRL